MNLIGMSLDGAKELLTSKGYDIKVISNTSDKVKDYDAILVTNAVFEENTCTLTVSPFLLNIKRD